SVSSIVCMGLAYGRARINETFTDCPHAAHDSAVCSASHRPPGPPNVARLLRKAEPAPAGFAASGGGGELLEPVVGEIVGRRAARAGEGFRGTERVHD